MVMSNSNQAEYHVTLEIKNDGYLSKPLDLGKTFFDSSVNIGQIFMKFEVDTPEKRKQRVNLSDFRTKIWLKSY